MFLLCDSLALSAIGLRYFLIFHSFYNVLLPIFLSIKIIFLNGATLEPIVLTGTARYIVEDITEFLKRDWNQLGGKAAAFGFPGNGRRGQRSW